jgi:DNA-binding transcriptional ArsR family regulator
MQNAPGEFDRLFGALADQTRRDLVRRALGAEEGIVELASHYSMSFAAVQKHIAILERAGLVTKERVGRRKVVRVNLEQLRTLRRLLDEYEELWRARTCMRIETSLPSTEALEQVLAIGTSKGQASDLGQIDTLLAENPVATLTSSERGRHKPKE